MSLLETVISVAQKKWEEKPRHDLVRSFVELRQAMVSCKSFYDEYQAICKQGPYEEWLKISWDRSDKVRTRFLDPRHSWEQSIIFLWHTIAELDFVLHIFGDDVSSQVFSYIRLEEAIEMSGRAERPGKFLHLKELKNIKGIFEESLDFDLDEDKLEPTFMSALSKLDAFIKTNFKMEEIYSAQKALRGDDDLAPSA